MNESCHTYEWVMSHIWMRHVTAEPRIRHTWSYICIFYYYLLNLLRFINLNLDPYCYCCLKPRLHIWMRHVTRINELRRTDELFMSHVWTSRVTRMNESFFTCKRVMSHVWTRLVISVNEGEWLMWQSANELCEWVRIIYAPRKNVTSANDLYSHFFMSANDLYKSFALITFMHHAWMSANDSCEGVQMNYVNECEWFVRHA